VTVSAETHAKLRRAQELLRPVVPNGDPAIVLDRALTLLVQHLERTKLAVRMASVRKDGVGASVPKRAGGRTTPVEARAPSPTDRGVAASEAGALKRTRRRRDVRTPPAGERRIIAGAGAASQAADRAVLAEPADGRSMGSRSEAEGLRLAVAASPALTAPSASAWSDAAPSADCARHSRRRPPRRDAPRSRYIPAAVRRAVWARDGGRCAFVGAGGRCTERDFLELHHMVPFAAGGAANLDNLSLRCRPHNGFEAAAYFSPDGEGMAPARASADNGPDESPTRSGPD
jgi:hypothetical protein